MKISKELIIGSILTAISAYYWGSIGSARPLSDVPVFYQYTYRLYPYLDIVLSAVGMFFFYRGLKKLRG
ncbi:MAG TPA: hypothetical protein VFG09_06755 [Thermodesulfovibrionales bacterium]|jgi:hypothetical protein|nr:hypothetical protein [Thermodesulfovibrionales bacterium]